MIPKMINDSKNDQSFQKWSMIPKMINDSKNDQSFQKWSMIQKMINDSKNDQWFQKRSMIPNCFVVFNLLLAKPGKLSDALMKHKQCLW